MNQPGSGVRAELQDGAAGDTQRNARLLALLRRAPVIPVLVIEDVAHAEPVARAQPWAVSDAPDDYIAKMLGANAKRVYG